MGVGVVVGVAEGAGVYGAGVAVAGGVIAATTTSMVAVGASVGVGVNVTTCPQALKIVTTHPTKTRMTHRGKRGIMLLHIHNFGVCIDCI